MNATPRWCLGRILYLCLGPLLVLWGCTPQSPPTPAGSESAARPSGGETAPGAADPAKGGRVESPRTSGQPTGDAAGKAPPKAIRELMEKIQPAGAPDRAKSEATAAAPKEPEVVPEHLTRLVPKAEPLALELVEVLSKGNIAAAEKLLLEEAALGKVLSPGARGIIAGSIVRMNRRALESYAAALKGKAWKSTFKPGAIGSGQAQGAIAEGVPLLSDSLVIVEADGVTLEIHLDQLIYFNDRWTIFRLRGP